MDHRHALLFTQGERFLGITSGLEPQARDAGVDDFPDGRCALASRDGDDGAFDLILQLGDAGIGLAGVEIRQ